MLTIVEDRRLPLDIDAQPVVQAAAALGEGSRDCAADAAGGAGDDDGAIVEAYVHGCRSGGA